MPGLLKDLFLLDPSVIFLNHGSFGACPRPVFEVYQEWQRRLERQPVQFIAGDLEGYFQEARQALGRTLSADPDDLVYVPNATFGVNVVARSLNLGPGDEVLATDHEYGACHHVWQFLSQKRGFDYCQQPIPLPAAAPAEIVAQFWQGVTPHTKVIFISHITSSTALRLPVEAICQRARAAGILTLVDGAHTPGQIDLDLEAIGADFYTGNCHKWLCSPKGAGFLHTRRDRQPLLEPLVVSWGWGPTRAVHFGSDYLDYLQWLGTEDVSAYLAVPAAIQFLADHDWPAVRQQCHEWLAEALAELGALTGLPPVYHDDGQYVQMAVAPLPPIADLPAFKSRLYQQYRIEVPFLEWNGRQFIRISVQGYNTPADLDTLLRAMAETLAE